ncbi:MAG: hypothetical protein HXY50_01620 [Ignavibacteriaceae bacterium]|nr:hypothetical protein [Ignavibacteriaceae bacterium]
MKTLSAFVVMLLISLTFYQTALGGNNSNMSQKKFSKNAIESIIEGLNSGNKGLIVGCIILAGDYKLEQTVNHLAKILNSNLTYDVKTAALFALYQIQNEDALHVLKSTCSKNKCPFLKQAASSFLNHFLICNPKVKIIEESNHFVAE